MTKWCIGLLILALVGLCSLGVYAAYDSHQNGPGHENGPGHQNGPNNNYGPSNHEPNTGIRADCRSIMQRTAVVLRDAQEKTERKHFRSGLGRAVAHQEKAQKLRRDGKFLDAIFHSLRARKIAFQVIRGNGQQINWDYWWNRMEKALYPSVTQ